MIDFFFCSMNFTSYDAFVGYQEDTPATIVLQASHIVVDIPHNIIDELDKVNELAVYKLLHNQFLLPLY